jgi:biopolymer transport protein ExbD
MSVQRFFDLWVVETNTVYRKVPYSVVTDWLQQGRLLDEDKVRLAGGTNWVPLGNVPAFKAYLPKAEPYRVEDKAEALEPVQVDFSWKPRRGDEDQDVDMIPLIDISLVLLIFFMMTAAVSTAAATIRTPEAENKLISIDPDMFWIGIDKDKGEQPAYSFGQGNKPGEQCASREDLIQKFTAKLREQSSTVNVRIRADQDLPYDLVREMIEKLGPFKRQQKIANIVAEVSEKKS